MAEKKYNIYPTPEPGQQYGKWTLVKFSYKNKYNQACWECKCDCGVFKTLRLSSVRGGHIRSCGCLSKKASSRAAEKKIKEKMRIIGTRIERLVVVSFSHSDKKNTFWNCVCDCGNKKIIDYSKLSKRRIKSCGCYSNHHIDFEHVVKKNAKRIYDVSYSDGDLSLEDFLELTQKKCHYCGAPPQNKFHICYTNDGLLKDRFKTNKRKNSKYAKHANAYFIYNGLDRIDSAGKHDKMNLVPCCGGCNTTKMATGYDEFLLRIKNIYENLGLDKKNEKDIKKDFKNLKRRKNK